MAVIAAGLCIAAWLTLAVMLALNFTGRCRNRRRPGFRWTGSGVLVRTTCVLLLHLADHRNWPYSESHLIANVMLILAVPVLVCAIVGLAVDTKARQL